MKPALSIRTAPRLLMIAAAFVLSACSQQDVFQNELVQEAKINEFTRSFEILRELPAPRDKVVVAVYSFDDQTGQFKANDTNVEYSSAVTKGGLAILNNALLAAGDKKWFTVVERGGLKNVLQERQIIRAMRRQYAGPNGAQLPDIPPMLYAGMLIEGGIVGYDTNTLTGGLAANYFGIGGTSEYRSDTVTVFLRAINIQTGEVMISTTTSKTIYSMALQANVFRYLTFDRLLQAETGFAVNEPVNLAVRQAIESAVYSMVMEGAMDGMWAFADPYAGKRAIANYVERSRGGSPEHPMQQQARKPEPQRPAQPRMAEAAPVAPVVAPAPAPAKPMMAAAPMEKPAPTQYRVVERPAPAPIPEPVSVTPAPMQYSAPKLAVPTSEPKMVEAPKPMLKEVAAEDDYRLAPLTRSYAPAPQMAEKPVYMNGHSQVPDRVLATTPPPIAQEPAPKMAKQEEPAYRTVEVEESHKPRYPWSFMFDNDEDQQESRRNVSVQQPVAQRAPNYQEYSAEPIAASPAAGGVEFTDAQKAYPSNVPVYRTSNPAMIVKYLDKDRYSNRQMPERNCRYIDEENCGL